jgi:DNA-binding NarL/FixJ family response regulator
MPYRILLADDHQLLLQGISSVLKEVEDLSVVATAANGFEVLEAVPRYQPHLVVLDLNMPHYDGLKCLQELKKNYPSIKVLILSNYSQPELLDEVKRLGADGYLNKNSASAELKGAVLEVLSGQKYYPAADEGRPLAEDSFFFDDFLKKYQLTRREVEIIRFISHGLSTKEIADKLFLSEFTISTHRKNILRKLDTKNIAGLVHFARQHQLT